VHPELLPGESCVLRSTMYFEFREMLDLRVRVGWRVLNGREGKDERGA
jgi:hypothetical protein